MTRTGRTICCVWIAALAACGGGGSDGGGSAAVAPAPPPISTPEPALEPAPAPAGGQAPAGSAPVANAGPDQNADLGGRIQLDGRSSSDADGDPLSYGWTVRQYPGIFAPTLVGWNTATPSFLARDPGTYGFSLVVNDGQHSSAAAVVTVTVGDRVGAVPQGSGLILGSGLNLWTVEESTLQKQVDFSCNRSFASLNHRPDGRMVALAGSEVVDVEPVAGVCVRRGETPELMSAFAVSPSGQYFGASNASHWVAGRGNVYYLYALSDTGATQSIVVLDNRVAAMAYGPGGVLYGTVIDGSSPTLWAVARIDPASGSITRLFDLPAPATGGDIHVDADGVLRTVIDGRLFRLDVATGAVLSDRIVPGLTVGFSRVGIVYVP